jgi:hypothetical protein
MGHFDLSAVEKAIKEKGCWEEFVEWRICTTTHFLITPVEHLDQRNQTKRLVYAVRVDCDFDLRCECPTLARALNFCDVFQNWIMACWKTEGWPSWAEKTKIKP